MQQIRAFVFSLHRTIHPKFQASSHLLRLYNWFVLGLVRKPEDIYFVILYLYKILLQHGSYYLLHWFCCRYQAPVGFETQDTIDKYVTETEIQGKQLWLIQTPVDVGRC